MHPWRMSECMEPWEWVCDVTSVILSFLSSVTTEKLQ